MTHDSFHHYHIACAPYFRIEYKKAASRAYNKKMIEAFAGNAQFPKVRTFNKTDTSTNSVFHDLEAAEML